MTDPYTFWRAKIDELDRKLVRLLVERAACAVEIGRIKLERGEGVYDPQREEEVMANVKAHRDGYLDDKAIQRIFERIIDETRRIEREHRKALLAGEAAEREVQS
ncbi:MAG: chorismate mutase [Acidobacteriota bacterium]